MQSFKVQKSQIFPVGHPTILTADKVQLTKLDEYFGLIKCTVLPPQNLYHPVLPAHIGKKLKFVLCGACAEEMPDHKCDHNDAERSLTGTWATPEVNLALQLGYKMIKVYEVWNFEQKSNNLFSGYVKMFLQEKFHSKGYPASLSTEEEKAAFRAEILDKEGVELFDEKMIPNSGRLLVSKLCLNCLWVRNCFERVT